jgi:hypothetical protein
LEHWNNTVEGSSKFVRNVSEHLCFMIGDFFEVRNFGNVTHILYRDKYSFLRIVDARYNNCFVEIILFYINARVYCFIEVRNKHFYLCIYYLILLFIFEFYSIKNILQLIIKTFLITKIGKWLFEILKNFFHKFLFILL